MTAGPAARDLLADPAIRAICLGPGLHLGPLRVSGAVTVWGPRDAVVRTATGGTAIEVTGAGAALIGFTVDGSGGSFDRTDAAVRVSRGLDIRIEGLDIVNVVFGIVLEQSRRIHVIDNHVRGSTDSAIGLRGDTVRVWETRESTIERNVIEDGRDILIWYSGDNQIADNHISRGRYGLHFMYSHGNDIARNRVTNAVVGVFVMYSRNLRIHDNVIAGAVGGAGMAIGLKESGNLELVDNRLLHDSTGIYIDNSPLQSSDTLEIARNELRYDDRAIVFHASGHRIAVTDNDFADNQVQVEVDGGGNALDVEWRDNYFDDYAGYDLDGDGRGDVPYEIRSLADDLASRHPNLALFRGTLALALVDAAAHLDPLYAPRPVLFDPLPRMSGRGRP